MDDSMDLVLDQDIGIELYKQFLKLWVMVGMYVRKWLFNVLELLEYILQVDCVMEVDFDKG